MRRVFAVAGLLLVVGVLFALPAAAQVYGKNKVQYEPLEWSVLETPHLRLHYYAAEESLARQLAVFAESTCVEYDRRFRIQRREKVPFLLYSVHHLFQQTNATPGFITEGVGGLTELIKGRVLLPHTGSWARLRWVTRHELAHSYMLGKISLVMRQHHRSQGYLPPLWFTEGFAEYCGTTWDEDAEGLLQDAVTSGVALPLTHSDAITGTVQMYKEGQSFLLYLAGKYGDERIFDLFDQWHRAEDFETLFQVVMGEPLTLVDEHWFASLRRHVLPVVAHADAAADVAVRMTPRNVYCLGPRVLPAKAVAIPAAPDTALRFCYFAATAGSIDLVLSEPRKRGGRRETKLLRAGASPQFESFHLFQNRPDASAAGLVVLTAKRGGRDALYVLDTHRRRVVRRMEFPGLVALSDPSFALGDTACVFSAQDEGGRRDLYRARWNGKRQALDRLTHDDYDDVEPDVSPDGRWVAFASDRCDRGGNYSLFRISLSSGTIEAVGDPAKGDDRQPAYSPDGRWIAFRSNRGGTNDLWLRRAEPDHEARRITRLLGPASDPDWLPDGKGVLFTGQSAIHFHAYRLAFNPDSLPVELETGAPRAPLLPVLANDSAPQRYRRKLGLDLVSNALNIDPGVGGGTGSQVALSDLLGNEQVYLFLANDSERFGNFWDGFQVGMTYVNRAQRMNWGFGVYRLTELYDIDLDELRRERRVGFQGLASYPFSKFTRVEASALVRHASNHLLRNGRSRDADLVSNYLALVHDNSRWTELGPSSGSRSFISGGVTRDLSGGAGNFATVMVEMRQYAMPLGNLVLATNAQAQSSFGHDSQRFYLGGNSSIRGYDRRALSGLQTVMLQSELRFPLLRGLVLAVPSTWVFPTINGAVFADAAWSWDHFNSTGSVFEQTFAEPADVRAGVVGASFFIGGGYYPALRWNYTWRTNDFRTFTRRRGAQFRIEYNF